MSLLPLLAALEHTGLQITLLEAYKIHNSRRNDAVTTPLICCLLYDARVDFSDDPCHYSCGWIAWKAPIIALLARSSLEADTDLP
jgi:hypothetical protein